MPIRIQSLRLSREECPKSLPRTNYSFNRTIAIRCIPAQLISCNTQRHLFKIHKDNGPLLDPGCSHNQQASKQACLPSNPEAQLLGSRDYKIRAIPYQWPNRTLLSLLLRLVERPLRGKSRDNLNKLVTTHHMKHKTKFYSLKLQSLNRSSTIIWTITELPSWKERILHYSRLHIARTYTQFFKAKTKDLKEPLGSRTIPFNTM